MNPTREKTPRRLTVVDALPEFGHLERLQPRVDLVLFIPVQVAHRQLLILLDVLLSTRRQGTEVVQSPGREEPREGSDGLVARALVACTWGLR